MFHGIQAYFSNENPGKQAEGTEKDICHNHVPCVEGGLIGKYGDAEFKEYVITHDANNPIYGEDGGSYYRPGQLGDEGNVDVLKTVKREIIYVKI